MDFETLKVMVFLAVPFVVATFWAVLDASQRDFGSINHKAAWMLVGAIPFVGFLIYLFLGIKRGKKPNTTQPPKK